MRKMRDGDRKHNEYYGKWLRKLEEIEMRGFVIRAEKGVSKMCKREENW